MRNKLLILIILLAIAIVGAKVLAEEFGSTIEQLPAFYYDGTNIVTNVDGDDLNMPSGDITTTGTGTFGTLSTTGNLTVTGSGTFNSINAADITATSTFIIEGTVEDQFDLNANKMCFDADDDTCIQAADDDILNLTIADVSGSILLTTTSFNFDSGVLVVDRSNDRVGIGTSAPAAELQVVGVLAFGGPGGGSLKVINHNGDTSVLKNLITYDWTSGPSNWSRMYIGDGGNDYIEITENYGFIVNDATNGETFRVEADGDVGIGTSSPGTRLDVTVDDATTNAVTDVVTIEHTTSGTSAANIGVGLCFDVEDLGGTEQQASLDVVVTDETDGAEFSDMVFSQNTGGAIKETLRLNAGEGATAADTLEFTSNTDETDGIVDSLVFKLDSTGTGATGIGMGMSFQMDDAGGLEEQASIDIILDDATNGSEDATMAFNINQAGSITEIMRLDGTSGLVGIGTTGPDRKLDILDATNPQLRLTHTDGSVYTDFQTDSNGDLTITPSGGDVDISGILDTTTLSVNNGTFTFPTVDGTASQFLQTDGSGNLSWATASGSGDVTGVGDCADGDCLDGSADGGTYIRIYDGDSNYLELNPGNITADRSIAFRDAAGTVLLSGDTLTGDITATFDTDGSTATALANDTVAVAEFLASQDWGDMSTAADGTVSLNTNVVQLNELDVSDVSDDIAGDIAEGELADSIVVSADIKDDDITHADIADADQATTMCIYIEDPTAADDLQSIWMNRTANAFTITEISCESDQTIDFDFQIDDGSPADVSGTDLQCAAGEAEDTSLGGDTELAADEELDLIVTSVANTPTWALLCWTGNWKD